jgi:hypothetical protein
MSEKQGRRRIVCFVCFDLNYIVLIFVFDLVLGID